MRKNLGILLSLALLLATLSGCARLGSQPTSWLTKTSSYAYYIKWTNNKGNISGTLVMASSNPGATNDSVKSENLNFTGLISNGNISLDLNSSATVTGTINNSHMVLNFPSGSNLVPVEFSPGQPKDFNDAVSTITAQVENSNRVVQQKATDEGFLNAISQLPQLEADVSSATEKINAARVKLDSSFAAESTYVNAVMSASCWNDAQYSHATALYDAVSSANDEILSGVNSLEYANSALANNNLTFATESTTFSASVLTKENYAALAKGEKMQVDAVKLASDSRARDQVVWDSAGSLIDRFTNSTACVSQ